MKRTIALMLVLLGILPLLLCCSKQKVMRLGVDAEILEIDPQNKALKVRCREYNARDITLVVDCRPAIEACQILYAEDEMNVRDISFGELQVGDTVSLSMEDEVYQQLINKQLKNGDTIQAYSVQLLTPSPKAE